MCHWYNKGTAPCEQDVYGSRLILVVGDHDHICHYQKPHPPENNDAVAEHLQIKGVGFHVKKLRNIISLVSTQVA